MYILIYIYICVCVVKKKSIWTMCLPVYYQSPIGVMVAHAIVNKVNKIKLISFADVNKLIIPVTTEIQKSAFSVYEKETISEVFLFS